MRVFRFALNRFLLLPLGALVAVIWANTDGESYFRFAHAAKFPVNEIGMAVFLGLVAQELYEDVMPGGALRHWRHWSTSMLGAIGGLAGSIAAFFLFIRMQDELHDTAKKYIVPGHEGTFAVISTMSAPFCSTCNRMRLTADGKMKNCLFSEHETDLLTPFRNGEAIEPLILQNISKKAKELGGQFNTDFEHLEAAAIHNRSMITIGG